MHLRTHLVIPVLAAAIIAVNIGFALGYRTHTKETDQ